ncbi:MAG: beta-galactosidase [Candidatus Geothermincolia bacterium]
MQSKALRLVALVLALVAATACGCVRGGGSEPGRLPAGIFGMELQADLMKEYENVFASMDELGVQWVRIGAAWAKLEPSPGQFNWLALDGLVGAARSHGISLLVTVTAISPWGSSKVPSKLGKPGYVASSPPLDMNRYSSFIESVVARYRGQGIAWQIENEPNAPAFWNGTREQYLELLKVAYAAAHRADPGAVVLPAGLACGFSGKQNLESDLAQIRSWHDSIMDSGAFDALDAHDYYPPEQDNPFGLTFRGYLQKIKSWMDAKEVDVPLWVSETGISSAPFDFGRGTASFTPEQQAEDLRLIYGDAAAEGITHLFWYKLEDTPEGVFTNMGLLATDHSRKPAWDAYRELAAASDAP